MPNTPLLAVLTATLSLGLGTQPGSAGEPARIIDARRVVFLGDSITYAGRAIEFIETWFLIRYPEKNIEFLNLGLPSETVSGLSEPGHAGGQFPRPDLHERLTRVMEKTRPDLVIACYGMNDGIYMPLDEARFQKFKDGLTWLHEQVSDAGARIILVTPPSFDEARGGHPGYADTLGRYADWMLAQDAVGWEVVALHGPMNRFLAQRRRQSPEFFLAGDGVHPGELGHWLIAKQILLHLGAEELVNVDDPEAMLAKHPNGEALLSLVEQRQRLSKDAWLTETGHLRPGMNKGQPLSQAGKEAAELGRQIRELQQRRAYQ